MKLMVADRDGARGMRCGRGRGNRVTKFGHDFYILRFRIRHRTRIRKKGCR